MHRFVFRTCGYVATMCCSRSWLAVMTTRPPAGRPRRHRGARGAPALQARRPRRSQGGTGGSGDGGGGAGATGCPELAGRIPMPELGPWMYGPSSDRARSGLRAWTRDSRRRRLRIRQPACHRSDRDAGQRYPYTPSTTRAVPNDPHDPDQRGRHPCPEIDYDDDARAITFGNATITSSDTIDDQGRPAQLTLTASRMICRPSTEIVYDGCRLVRREQGEPARRHA